MFSRFWTMSVGNRLLVYSTQSAASSGDPVPRLTANIGDQPMRPQSPKNSSVPKVFGSIVPQASSRSGRAGDGRRSGFSRDAELRGLRHLGGHFPDQAQGCRVQRQVGRLRPAQRVTILASQSRVCRLLGVSVGYLARAGRVIHGSGAQVAYFFAVVTIVKTCAFPSFLVPKSVRRPPSRRP